MTNSTAPNYTLYRASVSAPPRRRFLPHRKNEQRNNPMQSSLYSPSCSSANFFHLSWASSNRTSLRPVKLACPKTLLKPLYVSSSVRTSFTFHDNHDLENPDPGNAYPLPIVVREAGAASRYHWDGARLNLVSLDANSVSIWDFPVDFEGAVRRLARISASALRDFFLPRQVSENYMQYVKWKFLHRVFSSALQVLATQAMFRAIGIGYRRSLPSAAALNWVLKDGLGRLCRCIYTASLASAFDTNLKRVRFLTSVLFTLSIGIELLTPVFPSYFLLLASLANIAKQISLACYLATGSAVHRSFAVADNLGEVSAKAQIQTVCFDNLGLVLAAFLNVALRNNQRLQAALPFVVYPIFSAIDLFGIYQGLNHVHLQTLTKDRLEIIINAWFQQGYVPSPTEVSKVEGINLSWTKGRELWPIRIGCLNLKGQLSELSRLTMLTLNIEDYYFICLENFSNGLSRTVQDKTSHGIVLCIREGANSVDLMTGILQGCYIRKDLLSREITCENKAATYPGFEEWFKLIKESKQFAEDSVNLLVTEMSTLGWACKNVLLTAQEQVLFSFAAD